MICIWVLAYSTSTMHVALSLHFKVTKTPQTQTCQGQTKGFRRLYQNAWISWWHHLMETFSTLLALCAGNSLVTGQFPSQRPVMLSFDVFIDLRLNKRLYKQSWGWCFGMPLHPLWRHCNVNWLDQISPKSTRKFKKNWCLIPGGSQWLWEAWQLCMLHPHRRAMGRLLYVGEPFYNTTTWYCVPWGIGWIERTTSKLLGPLLLTWINFNHYMDKYFHPLWSGRWNYLLLIHSQTSTAVLLKFGDGYVILPHALLGMWLLIHAEIEVNPC